MQIKFPTADEVAEDELFVDKVLKYKWPIVAVISGLLAVAIFIAGGGARRMTRERDFFVISQSLDQLINGDEEFNESKILKLMKEYPEVASDFDYFMRDDKVIEGGAQEEVKRIEDRMISRLSYLHPFYLEHMTVIQLIEQKNQVEARDRAAILKEKIEKEGINKFPKLYLFVLARYGYLQGELGFSDVLTQTRQTLRELVYGDSSILGAKAQKEMQHYMEEDKMFFSKFFD